MHLLSVAGPARYVAVSRQPLEIASSPTTRTLGEECNNAGGERFNAVGHCWNPCLDRCPRFGFILIAALAVGLRYDLVRANALKVVCTAFFSGAALSVFIASGHVDWIPGIALAAGNTVGALISVRFALNVSQRVIKWVLFVMVS